MKTLEQDMAVVNGIAAVPAILDVVCRTTGMGFAAVARVTEQRWIACSVLDRIDFGLKAGGELQVESTICHEIRQMEREVVIDHVAEDPVYRDHHTPRKYGFQSYISTPIFLRGRRFFGTLCAIDPRPARLNTPEVVGMFKLFAELIASHIDAAEQLGQSESRLLEARESSLLREQFIGVLGHDLRNPLGALLMGASLLGMSPLNAEQADAVSMMKRNVKRMTELIDDAMDFTRGRLGGGIPVDSRTDEPLEPVLQHVIEEVQTNWPKRAIEAEIALPDGIAFDPQRFAQLFTNLLTNAMTYGRPDQPVRIVARVHDSQFELSVANAATPIPIEVQKRLFEPFSRDGAGRNEKGLGLGLYIAAEIAKSHGGTLSVVSNEAETRFAFRMPVSNSPVLSAVKPQSPTN